MTKEVPWQHDVTPPNASVTAKRAQYGGRMRSDAEDVDTYLARAPEERRAVLSEIRDICRELLTGFDESMSYGMPGYGRDGVTEIAWASQKHYISLYVLHGDVLDAHRHQLAHLSVGQGCIRYRNPASVDLAVIRSMLTAVASSHRPVC
jgi:uncharacterized protein YdhG (YjbR/CyaY superfamily)